MLLQQLGPTYVKIGQMIASRGDALPPDLVDGAVEAPERRRAVPLGGRPRDDRAASWASDPEELYASIEHEPFAAASTAQVHRATLHDGTVVAVKVQRPRIVAKTKADLGVITRARGHRGAPAGPRAQGRPAAMVREFAGGVLKELDYRNEAYHAKRLADNMARFPEITVPRIYDDLSGTRVLTMEFINGIKISKVEALREAGFDTGRAGLRVHPGRHQADPHRRLLPRRPAPRATCMADPPTSASSSWTSGLVGQLNSTQRVDLLGLIYALKAMDIPGIADGLIALGTPTRQFDEAQFRSDIDRLARQYLVYGGVTSIGGALSGFMGAVFNNGLRLDSSLTLAIKATIQAEETATRPVAQGGPGRPPRWRRRRPPCWSRSSRTGWSKQLQGTAVRVVEGARPASAVAGGARRSSGSTCSTRARSSVEVDTSAADPGRSRGRRPGPPGDDRA